MQNEILLCKSFRAVKFFTLPETSGERTILRHGTKFTAHKPVTEMRKNNLDTMAWSTGKEDAVLCKLLVDGPFGKIFEGLSEKGLNNPCIEQDQFLTFMDLMGYQMLHDNMDLSILFLLTPIREKVNHEKTNLFILGADCFDYGGEKHLRASFWNFNDGQIIRPSNSVIYFLFSLRGV
jgi:hypothetical protein